MANPFSGFLQPPQQRSPLEGTAEFLMATSERQRQHGLDAQRKLENEQQNTRANAYLSLQQGDQAHRWGKEEQKQVESLLAEYQDAEDQGDPVRLSRAAQMLQRFGMDVGQKQLDPRAAAFTGGSLKTATGERLLPEVKQGMDPRAAAFTGGNAEMENPIDAAVSQELKSREALRARNSASEQDLPQEDFEQQLIDGAQTAPSRYESGGKTTEEFRKQLPPAPADEPVDMGDVDSPAFKQAAAQEGGIVDLDADDPRPPQIGAPQQAQTAQQPRRLSTQLLPTVISKGGKQLYESTGPSGRYSSMVQSIFEPFTSHENAQIAEAARGAQAYANKLIHVDGVSPSQAIEMASKKMDTISGQTLGLERTKIGSKPRYGVGGAAVPTMKDRKPFNEEMNRTYMQFKSEKLDEQFQGYNAGIGAISSANTASQYDALNRLIQARSGLTVSDKERAIYDNLAGMWNGLVKKFNLLSGGELPGEYRNQLRGLMTEARQAVVEEKERRAQAAAKFYKAKTRGADPASVDQDAEAVADAIRMGAGGGEGGGEYGGL